jgi:hypothetical protein
LKISRETADVQEVHVLESTTQFAETTEKVISFYFFFFYFFISFFISMSIFPILI